MSQLLRPSSIDDLSEISQLMQRAFKVSPDVPFLNPSVMAWKYWDRRDDWEGPRSYVLERDGVVVAHAGILPVTFGAGEARGVQMIDWVSAKESAGAGVALLWELVDMFDFMYSIGGSQMTSKILPALGFTVCARQWKGARPLRPLRQILTHQYRNWKLPPRLVRNSIWALPTTPGRILREGWKAEEIVPCEISDHFYSQRMSEACFSPRPPAYFEYLLRCPVMPMHLYSIEDHRGPKGHFAIGVLRGQARVAGVWLRDPIREAWQAAFFLAQQAAKRLEGACEILVAGTEGPSEQAATQSGVRILGRSAVYLLNRTGKLTLSPDYQFQLSDDDGAYLDEGETCYLT